MGANLSHTAPNAGEIVVETTELPVRNTTANTPPAVQLIVDVASTEAPVDFDPYYLRLAMLHGAHMCVIDDCPFCGAASTTKRHAASNSQPRLPTIHVVLRSTATPTSLTTGRHVYGACGGDKGYAASGDQPRPVTIVRRSEELPVTQLAEG